HRELASCGTPNDWPLCRDAISSPPRQHGRPREVPVILLAREPQPTSFILNQPNCYHIRDLDSPPGDMPLVSGVAPGLNSEQRPRRDAAYAEKRPQRSGPPPETWLRNDSAPTGGLRPEVTSLRHCRRSDERQRFRRQA